MKGGPTGKSWGFTIVETMIVLAVSGVILFATLGVVNGRQNRTEFDVAIRQAQQTLQSTVNDISSGFYPKDTTFSCVQQQTVGGSKLPPRISTTNANQYADQRCVFLGKIVQFAPAGNDTRILAMSIAANATSTSGSDVTNLDEAQPLVIYPGNSATSSPVASATETDLQYGLSIVSATYTAPNSTNELPVGALAFLNSFPGTDAYGTASGSNNLVLYAISTSEVNQDTKELVDVANINSPTGGANYVRAGSVSICVASGGTDQSGLIKIGGAGNQTGVTLTIKKGKSC